MTYIQALAVLGVVLVAAIVAFFGKRYFLAAAIFVADAYLWLKLKEFSDFGGSGLLLLMAPLVLAVALAIGFAFDYANHKVISLNAGKTRFRQTLLWLLFSGIVIAVAVEQLFEYSTQLPLIFD